MRKLLLGLVVIMMMLGVITVPTSPTMAAVNTGEASPTTSLQTNSLGGSTVPLCGPEDPPPSGGGGGSTNAG